MIDKYLAHDAINSEYEFFDKIEDAREWLEETFLDADEGYHPDMESCKIYELAEEIETELIASKEDFTEEQWGEKYNPNFDEVIKHKWISVLPVIEKPSIAPHCPSCKSVRMRTIFDYEVDSSSYKTECKDCGYSHGDSVMVVDKK